MSGTAQTSIELELEWSGSYSGAEPDVGYAGGWEDVTLEGVKFDITDYKLKDGQLVRTTRTVKFDLTPEQVAMIEALFADDAAENMTS
jgi:hypothetical protein